MNISDAKNQIQQNSYRTRMQEEKHKMEMDNLSKSYEAKLENLKSNNMIDHKQRLENNDHTQRTLVGNYENKIEKQTNTYEHVLKQVDDKSKKELTELMEQFKEDSAKQKMGFKRELELLEESFMQIEEARNAEFSEYKKKVADDMENLKDNFSYEKDRIINGYENKLKKLEKYHRKEMVELQQKLRHS